MGTYAAHWGPEALLTPGFSLRASTAYTVMNGGTNTPATLFTDRTLATPQSNPGLVTTAGGNAEFFAGTAGYYDIWVGGALVLSNLFAYPDPADVATDTAVLHKTGTETVAGVKTFSGHVEMVSGVPWVELRGVIGSDPTGGSSSQSALNSAETTLTSLGGGVLSFGPGTWALNDASWNPKPGIVYQGASPQTTIIVPATGSTNAIGFTGNSNWAVRDLTLQTLPPLLGTQIAAFGSSNVVLSNVYFSHQGVFGIVLTDCEGWRVERCRFNGKADANAAGTAIQMTRCRNIHILFNRFRNFAAGIIGAGGGASSYSVDVSENIWVIGNDFDGQWINQPAPTSNSGGTVTYSATVLTDSAASFSGILANTTVRIMPVRQSGTATSITRYKVTNSGADFIAAGVRKGDMLVVGTVYGLVAAVESTTALTIETWLVKATNIPTDPPAAGAYTIYRLLFGSMTSFTSTTITVARWMDLDGNAVTPTSATRYEVCYGPTSHPMYFEAGFRYVNVLGNTCRRGWGDQIRFLGNYCKAIGNTVEDGFDVGIESEGGQFCTISDNTIRGQGVWGILTGFDTECGGNIITDTPWLNPVNGSPICVGASRASVHHNKITRGRSALCRFGVLMYASGAALTDNTITANTFKDLTTVSSVAPTMVAINSVGGGTVARTFLNNNTNPDAVVLWTAFAGSSGITDIAAPSGLTSDRPAAAVAASFGQFTYMNTTTGKPNFTNGSSWVLSDGTAA